MQISDYISGVALIVSGVAIYFCWANNKQKQKLLSGQKKTELLQKIDMQIFKLKFLQTLHREMLCKAADDKEFQDYVYKHLDKDSSNIVKNSNKTIERMKKRINEFIKEMSDTRVSFEKIDININPVLFEEELQHANRQLLSVEHIISEADILKKQRQDIDDEYHKLKEEMLNNKESD